MSASSLFACSAAAVLRRICGGGVQASSGLSRHLPAALPVATIAVRCLATLGQDVKEGTEGFTLPVGPDSSSDDGPDAILYDPRAEVVTSQTPPVKKPDYTPPWQRGKTSAPETSKAIPLPDSDPALRTENDSKDI